MEWIVTDNIYRETWRRILEFSNRDIAVEAIENRHGSGRGAARNDYLKQASQVRVCALQAKEYFDAARASSLFTSPNHAYYGAVSLTSMMMLLLGDGTRSLDYLRKDSKNTHHGLNFSTGCTAKSAAVGLTLVEQSFVEILANGHFVNWYSTLPSIGIVAGLVTKHASGNAIKKRDVVGHFDVPKIDKLVGTKHAAVQLLKYLPDLNGDLSRYSIAAPRSRTSHVIEIHAGGAGGLHLVSSRSRFAGRSRGLAVRVRYRTAIH